MGIVTQHTGCGEQGIKVLVSMQKSKALKYRSMKPNPSLKVSIPLCLFALLKPLKKSPEL